MPAFCGKSGAYVITPDLPQYNILELSLDNRHDISYF